MINNIHNIDVLEGLKKLDDNSIDCIITSPPYNKLGLSKNNSRAIQYDIFNDNMNEKDYQNWQINILNECHRVLKDGGSMFYNHKNRRFKCKEYTPFDWILKTNMNLYQTIIWNRKADAAIFNTFLLPIYEYVFWMTKDNKTPKVFRNRLDNVKSIWDINPDKKNKHPAPFPSELVKNCILLSTNEGDIVLDPFSGSGTTCNVAKELNRNYIGFEISEDYINKEYNISKVFHNTRKTIRK
jgi:site-specific DNA-methyltransferase (adenine-specific)